MPTGDWIITTSGALLSFAGLVLLAWSLLADRIRTRRRRKQGTLRRCPKCWYDMAAVAGLRCPECGRETKRERGLRRSRQRWRPALAALLVLAAGAGAVLFPHTAGGAWKKWVPDTALILLIPLTTETGWAAEEMALRLGMWGAAPSLSTGRELRPWQARLLTAACIRAIKDAEAFPARPMAWWLIMCSSPNPEAAFDCFIEQLGHDDPKLRLWGAMCLGRTRFFLSDTQLATALDTIRASPAQASESAEMLRLEHAAAIDHQLRSRAASDHHDKLRVIAEMPLSPEALQAALEGASINELIALHRRLGIRRTQLFDADETLEAAIEVRTTELCIDRDDLPDHILLVSNRHWRSGESNIHYEAIVLLQHGDGWRLAGMIDLSNSPATAPSFRTVSANDGERWLVVRRDGGSSPDGSYFIQQDAWYRVKRGGLCLEQAVMPRAFSSSRFHQTLEPSEPRVIRRAESYLASYDISSTISLAVPEPDSSNRLVPIAAERGTFEYPLGVPDAKLGQHVPPGPWERRDCWWAILEDPDILAVYKAELLTLARSEDAGVRAALQAVIDNYLTFLSPTPELIEIQRALDQP